MLWDMARYQNYDIRSPYNREAALWAANQTTFKFPIDPRPLRDKRVALGRSESSTTLPWPDKVAAPKREPESVVILDMEIDLRPRDEADRPIVAPTPVPAPADDVIFID